MIVCVPVQPDGQLDPRWGRAARVAVADVQGGKLASWQEFDVGWDRLHDVGTEGGHHARIAQFLRDNNVQVIVASHVGEGIRPMFASMGVELRLGASGDARAAALSASRPQLNVI